MIAKTLILIKHDDDTEMWIYAEDVEVHKRAFGNDFVVELKNAKWGNKGFNQRISGNEESMASKVREIVSNPASLPAGARGLLGSGG